MPGTITAPPTVIFQMWRRKRRRAGLDPNAAGRRGYPQRELTPDSSAPSLCRLQGKMRRADVPGRIPRLRPIRMAIAAMTRIRRQTAPA